MKLWWRIVCFFSMLIVIICGIYNYIHSSRINRLLDRAGLSGISVYKELWYSYFDMGLGYTDGYEVLILQLPSIEINAIASDMNFDFSPKQLRYTLQQVLSYVPRSCHPNVLRDIPSELNDICFSSWQTKTSSDEHIFYALSDLANIVLIYRVHSFGTN